MGATLLIDLKSQQWAINYHLKPERENRIGRTQDNDVCIPTSTSSSRHATITKQGDKWLLKDLGSKNGTKLNGYAIKEAYLNNGDSIELGDTQIVFRNPDQKEEDGLTVWGVSARALAREEAHLRKAADENAIDQMESIIWLPEVLVPNPEGTATVPPPGGAPAPALKPAQLTPVPVQRVREDYVWVCDQLVNLLGEMVMHEGKSKDELYQNAILRLCRAIGAENGFVMIVNQRLGRWEIRAWTGNHEEWSAYEKAHPVPLTAANAAFNQRKMISNAIPDAAIASESMNALNVHCYIVSPLVHNGTPIGVLYFDARRTPLEFAERHIMLLEKAAQYFVKVEMHGV